MSENTLKKKQEIGTRYVEADIKYLPRYFIYIVNI